MALKRLAVSTSSKGMSVDINGTPDNSTHLADAAMALLADAAMALLACRTEDEVYELAGSFTLRLVPDAVVIVNELSPDLESLVTRKVFGMDAGMLTKVSELVGFDLIGKRSAVHPKTRDAYLSGTLTKIPGGIAEAATAEIPRALAETGAKMFGLREAFSIGIADGDDAVGNIQICTRTPHAVLPTQIIEFFAHHCYSVLTGIRRERALADANDRMSQLIDSMVEGLALHEIILDEDGQPCDYRFVDVNPAFEAMTGLRAADILGRTVREVIPGVEQSWIERYGAVATTGDSAEFEDYAGVIGRYYSVAAYCPEPGQFATVVSDITERKQQELALEQSQALLRSSLESQRDTILFSIDPDYRYLYFNQAHIDAMRSAYGQDIEIGGCVLDHITSHEDRVAAKRNYDRALAGKSHSNIAVYGDVKKAYYESFFNPMVGDDGQIIGATGMARDITERVLANEELVRVAALLESTGEMAKVGGWELDIRTDTLHWSPGTYRIYEIDPTVPPSTAKAHECYTPEARAGLEAMFRAAIESGTPWDFELPMTTAKGREVWVRGQGVAVMEDGVPVRLRGSMQDITDRKADEFRLRDLVEERERNLDRIAESLSSMIGVVSRVVEARDPYTAGHERRVAELATRIAQHMSLPSEQVDDIRTAALVHDVGKVSVPAEILSRPGELSDIEFNLIKGHSEAGFQILSSANMGREIAEMVYQHHERCDGSGYPRGIAGSELLEGAKVLMVADVVEAMISHRPYRPGLGVDAALAEIERGLGTLYDPQVAESCLRVFRDEGFEFSAQ